MINGLIDKIQQRKAALKLKIEMVESSIIAKAANRCHRRSKRASGTLAELSEGRGNACVPRDAQNIRLGLQSLSEKTGGRMD